MMYRSAYSWLQLLAVCLCFIVSKPNRSSKQCTYSQLREEANSSHGVSNMFSTNCTVQGATDVKFIEFPDKILSLSLSFSQIEKVGKGMFQNFTSLRKLYLDHCSIMDIDEGGFSGLANLEHLDLSHNRLKTWSGLLTADLPALRTLNLAHNEDFLVDKNQLMNANCTITGVNINAVGCKACNLTRVQNITREMLIKVMLGKFKRHCIYFPEEHNDQLDALRKVFVSFDGGCMNNKRCFLPLTNARKALNRYLRDVCYPGTRPLRPLVYIFGLIALVMNLVVVTSILNIPKLRRMVPFLLIAHLSFCDMLTGLYALGTAVGHEISPNYAEIEVYRTESSKCPVFWVVFLLGQTLSVLTCLLVTVERYFATVYCMKPALKLQRRTACLILLCFWVIAIIIAIPVQLIDYKKITLNFMCVMLRDYSPKRGMLVSQGLMIAFLALYTAIVFLYVRIYIYVRDSSRRVNIRREARLAKRIGLIVLTNFVCFAFPNLSMLVLTTLNVYAPLDDISNTIVRRWLPPMFLVLNASANPCLFAYGNSTFSASFRGAIRSFCVKHLGFSASFAGGSKVSPSSGSNTSSIVRGNAARS